ncbi:hypothetical protein CFH99_15160 [Nocardioides aromaticivorans]|uniref:DUF559 domain-containing protein n=1 Tax=Nocardioides aromaticivorans TaxID=200618 RepID=A0ABX7PMC6_9ACTN|nr:hypothetical protein [Nocardioides aromaticivorans]QSR26968.1 hypothetical protein CFH99_15160 [Nocardioides aromaticivorans]
MDPVDALAMAGGVAKRRHLIAMSSRRQVDRAARSGAIARGDRSTYRLPDLDRAAQRALALGGRVAVLSAAVSHGWEVPSAPIRPWIMFDHHASAAGAAGVEVVWGDLSNERGLVLSERRTVLDCARRLPFDIALSVADSALRHGVDHETFIADAARLRGKGSAQAREVARLASPLAANPFESKLRALAIRAGLDVLPQGEIQVRGRSDRQDFVVHPDVVDRGRRLAIEAESWEFHTSRKAFERDCHRYTLLTLDGWTVLRFTWWQVMHDSDWVLACLSEFRERVAGTGRRAAS